MADLGLTDAAWIRLLGRKFAFQALAPMRLLRETSDRFRRERVQVAVVNDYSSFLDDTNGGATFAGVHPGSNCTSAGIVYVRLTGNGATRTVSAYSATGGSGLVAQGSAADGNTVTLTAQNSSGLSGTWRLPASASNTTADELSVHLVPDFQGTLATIYDGTDTDDSHASKVLKELYDTLAVDVENALVRFRGGLSRYLLSDGNENPQAFGNEWTDSNEVTLISDVSNTDDDGNVTHTRTGWLEAVRRAMNDETTGSTQYVVKRVASAAAGSFGGNNDGQGSVASHTPGQACPASKWHFYCTNGGDTDAVGEEKFSYTVTFTTDGDERVIRRDDGPTVGQPWYGPYQFGPITLARTLTKTNDGSNNIFTAASNATVTGENNNNTDTGVVYWKTTANGSDWDVEFFSSSTLTASTLVAKATAVASAASFTASSQNSSNLEVVWQLGGTESATNGQLNLNVFKVENASGEVDYFDVTVTETSVGTIQRIVSGEFGDSAPSLNATTSGSETIEDGYAKCGTFIPFSVTDN